jgi:hypothetical protein
MPDLAPIDLAPGPVWDDDADRAPDLAIQPSSADVFEASAGQAAISGPVATLGRMAERTFGTSDAVAEQQQNFEKEKLSDEWIAANRPSSWGGFGASIAGDLAGTAIDPVNIAASFIPVSWFGRAGELALGAVGMEREAAQVASMAKAIEATTAGRVTAAGVQNAGAVALTQPILLAGAQQDHADYTFGDAAMNVLFGGLLGAGLHGAGEALDATVARGMLRIGAKAMDDGQSVHPQLAEDMVNLARPQITEDLIERLNPDYQQPALGFQSTDFKDALDTLNLQRSSRIPFVESGNTKTADDALSDFAVNPQVGRVTEALDKLDKVGDISKGMSNREARQLTAITHGLQPLDLSESMALAAQEAERVREANNIQPEEKEKIIQSLREFGNQVDDLNKKIPSVRTVREMRQLRIPTESQIAAETTARGDSIVQGIQSGKYDVPSGTMEPIGDTDAIAVQAKLDSLDENDLEGKSAVLKAHTTALENDPALNLSDAEKEEVNKPIQEYQKAKKLIDDFQTCVEGAGNVPSEEVQF